MKVVRTYKYRLFPSKSQISKLNTTFELCRQIYNSTLNLRKYEWEVNQKAISKFDSSNILVQWKKNCPELKFVHSQVAQQVQERVDMEIKCLYCMTRKRY